MSLRDADGGWLEGSGGLNSEKDCGKTTKEVFFPSGDRGGCEMQGDLPQRFPIYDVSGMKDGSSDHNACLSEAAGLCASLPLRAGRPALPVL